MTTVAWGLAAAGAVGCVLLARALGAANRRRRLAVSSQDETQRGLDRYSTEVARLRASLGGLGGGLIVLDTDQRIVAWNAAARDLAGVPEHPGVGRSLAEVLPWERMHDSLAELASAGIDPESRQFQLVEIADGEDRVFVVRLRSLGGLGYVIEIDDQSHLKRLESMRRDFVANVSHELKTPLAAIKGIVETLLDDAEMPKAVRQRFLEGIGRQSDRLNSLVGDLLTLSRLDEIDTTTEASATQPWDLAVITAETVRDLASLATRRGIDLAAEITNSPRPVRGDAEGLRQVVSNLVDNAIKYTSEGGQVTVRLTEAADHLRLEVQDTGIGLSPEDQKRVFERFYRVDRARSREMGGTGLGLSIVKNTVRGFGGEVGVDSTIGSGSTFWVTLPHLPNGS